jgi:hypothetical protein
MKRTVRYSTTAVTFVTVDVPNDTDPDRINDVARELADGKANAALGRLCASCSSQVDLGEFVQDDDDEAVQ